MFMQAQVKTVFMDWFVFGLVIFSIINNYDGVVVVLDGFGGVKEWFQLRNYGKKDGKIKTVRAENGRKQGWVWD